MAAWATPQTEPPSRSHGAHLHVNPSLWAADNGTAGADLGDEELYVAAWGTSYLDLLFCSRGVQCHVNLSLWAADNGTAGADLGDEELDVAAWGEPELNLDGEGQEANGFEDEDGLAEPGADGDEEGGWDMEVGGSFQGVRI